MGRVYRAVQRVLDRPVAIKFIDPTLADSDEIVARFLAEARALSRLNHPNVVTIHDFGVTSPAEGSQLFLVMEYLNGFELRDVLQTPLTNERIVDIVTQTLAALAEAHHRGLTHRDVKPEHIILEPGKGGGGDQVKLIDFGISHAAGQTRITHAGRTLGTPEYMSPEQTSGSVITPASDLYSVGVVLFEMLTGTVPFGGPATFAILQQHQTATRPDPRAIAAGRRIPALLAEVCIRAMSIDAADRYPNAEAFAKALARATSSRSWSGASLFPPDATFVEPSQSATPREPTTRPELRSFAPPPLPATPTSEMPLVGRAADIAWFHETLADAEVAAIVFQGRPGMGRTRMLRVATTIASECGAKVIVTEDDPPPVGETGHRGLRRLLHALYGADPESLARDEEVALDLRMILRGENSESGGMAARSAAAAALRWAALRAVERAHGAPVVLAIDDLDHFDRASRRALGDALRGPRVRGLTVVATTVRTTIASMEDARVRVRELRGLSAVEVKQCLEHRGVSIALVRTEGIEPLYVEHLCRAPEHGVAPTLTDLAQRRINALSPAERRVLQAISVLGRGSEDEVRAVIGTDLELREPISTLAAAGLIGTETLCARHATDAEVALSLAPAGALIEMHERRASYFSNAAGSRELEAYHAMRGRPSAEVFARLEEAARLRTQRGDDEGAAEALWWGVNAGRTLLAQGDEATATDAWSVLGPQLADSLLAQNRTAEAEAVLVEIGDLAASNDRTRALMLEKLALIAEMAGRLDLAQTRRRAALQLAEQIGDRSLARRIGGGLRSQSHRRALEQRETLSADEPSPLETGARARFDPLLPLVDEVAPSTPRDRSGRNGREG